MILVLLFFFVEDFSHTSVILFRRLLFFSHTLKIAHARTFADKNARIITIKNRARVHEKNGDS